MKRGAIVIAVQPGTFTGKPRPFLVLQHDIAVEQHPTIVACLLTTELTGLGMIRIPLIPAPGNGLTRPSEIQIDKLVTLRRSTIDAVIGHVDAATMRAVDDALRRWLDL